MNIDSIAAYGRSTTSTALVTNPVRRLLWWLIAPYFRGAGIEISGAVERQLQAVEPHLQASLRNMLTSELGAHRKDINAIAFRLGGLDEEVASNNQTYTELSEWLSKMQVQVQEHSTTIATLHIAQQQIEEQLNAPARGAPMRAGDRIVIDDSGLVIVQTDQGTRMLVQQRDHIGRIIADGHEWEPHVREAIERAADPDGVAIDAGAYIGVHTLTMASSFRQVHAFEPQQRIYQTLCGNLALNSCSNVTTHNVALYDRAGSVRLAPPERQDTAIPLKDGEPDYANIPNAAALTYDFLPEEIGDVRAIALDELAFEHVRLIKVDTQGADLRVLQGAINTIRRWQPIILFEWERDLDLQHGTNLDAFLCFFAELNYEVTRIHDTTPGRQADYLAKPR